MWGVDTAGVGDGTGALAAAVARRCYESGLVIERCGRGDTVLKLLPPLTIAPEELVLGLSILRDCVAAELAGAIRADGASAWVISPVR